MSDQTKTPPLPGLPWTGTCESGVVSVSGYSIAHVDPMFRFSAEEVHRISRFLAAAPETAEKLQDTTEKLRDLVKEVDRALLALGEFGWSGRYDALRAAADRARGA